jgi:hypothetical protein
MTLDKWPQRTFSGTLNPQPGIKIHISASKLGKTEASVAGLIRRGLKKLHQLLKSEGD